MFKRPDGLSLVLAGTVIFLSALWMVGKSAQWSIGSLAAALPETAITEQAPDGNHAYWIPLFLAGGVALSGCGMFCIKRGLRGMSGSVGSKKGKTPDIPAQVKRYRIRQVTRPYGS